MNIRQSLLPILIVCVSLFSSAIFAQDRDTQIREMRKINPRMPQPIRVDDELVQAAGIRKIESKYLVLYTDIRGNEAIDQFGEVFDAAVPQWCEKLKVDPARTRSWKMVGVLIGNKESFPNFEKAGLLPDDLPAFPAGFNRGHEFWVLLQPDLYYTRHLLLHEGTHAFMQWFLGGSGPSWYSEGMAELFGLHQWQDGKLELAFRPTDRNQTKGWGRPKVITRDRSEDRVRSLDDIMAIGAMGFRDVDNYAWSWAACEFLLFHPATQKHFLELTNHCKDFSEAFSIRFRQAIESDRQQINRDWYLFIDQLEYGSNVRRSMISKAKQVEGETTSFAIFGDRSWQTTLAVKKGQTIRLKVNGQFQVGIDEVTEKPLVSKANGITIQYYRGRPLGMLLGGVLNKSAQDPRIAIESLMSPIEIGSSGEYVVDRDGIFCFRVNDSTSLMNDNSGGLIVEFVE